MDLLLKIISVGGSAVLAFMGVLVSLRRKLPYF